MQADDQPTPEPKAPASEPLPAGVLCYQCQYDLVGRVPSEACPECGLDVAASWPVWDLRACHPSCVAHVLEECRMLHWAALTGWVVAAATLVAAAASAFQDLSDAAATFGLLAAFVSVGAMIGLPLMLAYAWHVVRKHPNKRLAPGAQARHALVVALLVSLVSMAGLLVAMLLGGIASRLWHAIVVPGASVVAVASLFVAGNAAAGYIDGMLARAGRTEAGTSRAFVVGCTLTVLCAALAYALVFGLDAGWAMAGAAGAMLAPAMWLVLRCQRAMDQVRAIKAERERAAS